MAKEYKVGERYYLPVRVMEIMDDTYAYPVRIEFENGNGCMDGMNAIKSDPSLLLTAYEVYACQVTALKDEIATLKSENERLSSEKGQVKHWRGMYTHMKARCDEYKKAADHLKEERDRADDELALTRIMNVALAEKIERLQNNG